MIPPGVSARDLLVVVDFSWWVHRAYHIGGLDGLMAMVVGNLAELMRGTLPAYLAVAVDSIGPTWRHELAETYKGNREPRPREFYALADRALEIVRLHRVPTLYAEGWEADDCMAAAVKRARADGLHVALLTADKDMAQLVADDVVLWDGANRVRRAEDIEADPKHPVPPALIGDLLAIVGDSADNVPGVASLGPVAAARILRAYGSVEAALLAAPDVPTAEEIKALERDVTKAKKKGGETGLAMVTEALAAARARRDLARDVMKLQAARESVLLSRRLVSLDDSAPIEWDLRELAVGGYEVDKLRAAYRALGFMQLADEVMGFEKKTPDVLDREELPPAEELAEAGDSFAGLDSDPDAWEDRR